MPFSIAGWEWIIILVIVLLLFGPGRISKFTGEVGKSIRAFREGIKGDEKEEPKEPLESNEVKQ
ncbi:MAG TPA: twin-arginine translocase TatA/TatE family subunit [Anaerolineales bacterium]|nr:twin-arginine translocase TatA/TatE family subunit [Anaerolineales bacterium]